MNDIFNKQNEPKNINLLKLASHEYTRIQWLAIFYFVASVIVPIVLTLVNQNIITENVRTWFNFIGAALTIFTLFFNKVLTTRKEYASSIQDAFDRSIYGMKQSNLDVRADPNDLQVKSSSINFKPEKMELLSNWYSDYSKHELNRAIFYCQKANIEWDKKLRKFYVGIIVTLIIIAVSTLISLAILFSISVIEMLSYIWLLMPIATYAIIFLLLHKRNLESMKRLETKIQAVEHKGEFSVRELESIQLSLYFHRKELIKVPNFFFMMFREKQQKEADILAKIKCDEID